MHHADCPTCLERRNWRSLQDDFVAEQLGIKGGPPVRNNGVTTDVKGRSKCQAKPPQPPCGQASSARGQRRSENRGGAAQLARGATGS
eukprot:2147980-Heterocapsa_arctica.AAC.1